MDGWIVVPNWNKFQHYGDRNPAWIKVYLELNSDDDWLALTTSERGVLVTIWIEYARSRGQLRVEKVHQLCAKSARSKHLESLNHAGFIQLVASKPLAHMLALARSREEEEEKKKNKQVRTRTKPAPPLDGLAKQNVVPADPFKAIVQMIRNGVIQDRHDLDAEIAGYRLNGDLADELREMLPR